MTRYLLLFSYHSLPITRCLSLVTYHSLVITRHLSLVPCSVTLNDNHSLSLIKRFLQPLVTNYFQLVASNSLLVTCL